MNLRDKITRLIETARQRPRYIVLGLIASFFLNISIFIYSADTFSPRSNLPLIVFFIHFVWPIALITFGIVRLRRGKSTDEAEIKRRREVTLRYFAIGTLPLLIMLIVVWRYNVQIAGSHLRLPLVIFFVIPILILSCLFVTIIWHWFKNSENKLSALINKAPGHYLVSIITFVITLICYIAYDDISAVVKFENPDILPFHSLFPAMIVLQFAAWGGIFISIGTAILGYLRPSEIKAVTSNNEKQDELAVHVEPPNDNKHLELTSSPFQPNNLESLMSMVKLSNSRIETLLKQLAVSSHPLIAGEMLTERVGLIRGRLTGELKELAKRGNLNLTIGILTTIGAASALFWGLIATQPLPNETQTAGLLRHYLPRISFAVFIEVFSFFFLRLYKNSLEDIKYYHNELTNLDSRLLALEIAAAAQLSEALIPILLGLLNTDRNFILKSGESTVELEKVKTEQQYLRTLVDAISAKIPDLSPIKKDSNKG